MSGDICAFTLSFSYIKKFYILLLLIKIFLKLLFRGSLPNVSESIYIYTKPAICINYWLVSNMGMSVRLNQTLDCFEILEWPVVYLAIFSDIGIFRTETIKLFRSIQTGFKSNTSYDKVKPRGS